MNDNQEYKHLVQNLSFIYKPENWENPIKGDTKPRLIMNSAVKVALEYICVYCELKVVQKTQFRNFLSRVVEFELGLSTTDIKFDIVVDKMYCKHAIMESTNVSMSQMMTYMETKVSGIDSSTATTPLVPPPAYK